MAVWLLLLTIASLMKVMLESENESKHKCYRKVAKAHRSWRGRRRRRKKRLTARKANGKTHLRLQLTTTTDASECQSKAPSVYLQSSGMHVVYTYRNRSVPCTV